MPLLQEVHARDPWAMLVACVLLNVTGRKQVDRVIDGLFARFPSPYKMAYADEREIEPLIRALGLGAQRAGKLKRLSEAWTLFEHEGVSTPSEAQVAGLPGVGKYALDSYRIFVLGDRSRFESGDKEIRKYLEGRAYGAD